MMTLRIKSIASIASTLVLSAALLAGLAPNAHAGADQVYGTEFAWDNNFNNSNIGVSFGTGSTANMTVSYNFGTGNLYGYPACIRGWHYGWNPANDTKYPKQIKSLGTDNASFAFSSGGTNMFGDFAYDLFLRKDSAKSTPQIEVMIWGKNNSWPIGLKVKTNTVNGQDLWMGYNSSAGYETFSFVPAGTGGGSAWGNGTSGSVNVNLTSYLNYLDTNYASYINSSDYLDVVEGGIEITGGNGWTWVQMSN
jgi:hypothetical protein